MDDLHERFKAYTQLCSDERKAMETQLLSANAVIALQDAEIERLYDALRKIAENRDEPYSGDFAKELLRYRRRPDTTLERDLANWLSEGLLDENQDGDARIIDLIARSADALAVLHRDINEIYKRCRRNP